MPDQVQTMDYYYTEVSDKPGEAARILKALQSEGVNLMAFSGFPKGRKSQLDFVPADPPIFVKAARKLHLKVSPRKTGFLIHGEDRVGALADNLQKLADAGINVTAVDAVAAGAGVFGAILWVKAEHRKRAAKALGV